MPEPIVQQELAVRIAFPAAAVPGNIPAPGTTLVKDAATDTLTYESAAAGAGANTILHGTGVPGSGVGAVGDFYIDTAASNIYGPKTSGGWGSPTSLIGPAGANGTNGTNGADGFGGSNIFLSMMLPDSISGTWTDNWSTYLTGHAYYNYSGGHQAIGDYRSFKVSLEVGTYTMKLVCQTDPIFGKVAIFLDGTKISPDWDCSSVANSGR